MNLKSRTALSLFVLSLTLTLAACGGVDTDATDPGATDPTTQREQITTGGIAALVDEHLGGGNVRMYGAYDPEQGSISLVVRLGDGSRRDMFAVNVYGPGSGQEFGSGGGCDASEAPGEKSQNRHCEEQPDGSAVSVWSDATGFSDDNVDGSLLMATRVGPGESVALAMYESYTHTMPVTDDDLRDLMNDERLTWLTDPALNVAGQDFVVRDLRG